MIEKYGERVPVKQHAFIPTPSTPADRKPLRSLVNAWAKLANVPVHALAAGAGALPA